MTKSPSPSPSPSLSASALYDLPGVVIHDRSVVTTAAGCRQLQLSGYWHPCLQAQRPDGPCRDCVTRVEAGRGEFFYDLPAWGARRRCGCAGLR